MSKIGFNFPSQPRQTGISEAEEQWYMPFIAERLNRELTPLKRSNFGHYNMAIHYLTSVIEESKAIEKVAVYNIDHMGQIRFTGKDCVALLDRALPANFADMKTGQCKYTFLLNEKGGVEDDMIAMKVDENDFILVINAGHDITDKVMENDQEVEYISDADRIMAHKKPGEDVTVTDISADLVKIDVQGPYSYKVISELFGKEAVRNRNNPKKNMGFFTFNEYEYEGETYFISRTGYTNRWGWELYIPAKVGVEQFKRIVTKAVDLGGLLVGLGGRDENRTSAGDVGLPLMGNEYRPDWSPVNSPLFAAAVDLDKPDFMGKEALQKVIDAGCTKEMVIVISEGIVVDRDVYLDGKKIGICTSSINSPNVSQEKREFIGSKRGSVNGEDGVAAVGLCWLDNNPFEVDEKGNNITEKDGKAIRIPVEFFRVDEDGNPKGRPVLGYISGDGVSPATSARPLKRIEDL